MIPKKDELNNADRDPQAVNKKQILNKWNACMDLNVPIHVCGMCDKRDIMTGKDCKLIHRGKLNICKVNIKKLKRNPHRRKAMNVVKIGKQLFHLVREGVRGDKVIVCKTCSSLL